MSYQNALNQVSSIQNELSNIDTQITSKLSDYEQYEKELEERKTYVRTYYSEIERLQEMKAQKLNQLKTATQSMSNEEKKLHNELSKGFTEVKKKSGQINDLIRQIYSLYGELVEDCKTLDSKGYRLVTDKSALNIPQEFQSSIASPDFRYAVMQHLLVTSVHNDHINLTPLSQTNGFLSR